MGHLPIPDFNAIWIWVNGLVGHNVDLNTTAREIIEKHRDELEQELIKTLSITNEEYNMLVEYGDWLNEQAPTVAPEGVEAGEEEEEES
jgi:hypothetical protein